MGVLLALSRVIDAINFRLGKVWLADPRGGHCVRRERRHPQAVRHVLQLMAGAAVGAVRRCVPDRRVLDVAGQRAHPHRHREQHCSRSARATSSMSSGMPFSCCRSRIIMIITSYPFVMKSLLLNEQSMNAGGLPQWPAEGAHPDRIHIAVLPGDFRADQAHRRDDGASFPTRIIRRAGCVRPPKPRSRACSPKRSSPKPNSQVPLSMSRT